MHDSNSVSSSKSSPGWCRRLCSSKNLFRLSGLPVLLFSQGFLSELATTEPSSSSASFSVFELSRSPVTASEAGLLWLQATCDWPPHPLLLSS
ncbi:hypothetical protein ADUPG1_002623 [Aduncisulcus paluster]|uniref:Uncharacterized protein n=1 Tax=Aduncisulcus paluster TaxID=2918883 RepID=A0ABQ5KMM4_9EUKA|nr:hypothetical protein ADUPG1_002623 [Aduncisulcus paluster]